MKKIIILALAAFMLAGCSDGNVPAPKLESEGVENIIVEDILVEDIIVEEIEIDPIKVEDVEKVTVETCGLMALVDFHGDDSDVYNEVKSVTMHLKNGGELTEPKEAFCKRFGVQDVLWDVNDESLWCVMEHTENHTKLKNFMTMGRQ